MIETLMWQVAERVLEMGKDVILDYGFWAREEREDFRERANKLGAASEVHFTDASREELFTRMEQRNAASLPNVFHIYPEDLSKWWNFFQRPDPDELKRRD
jgi:predicted kinase